MPLQCSNVDRTERELKFSLAAADVDKVKSLAQLARLRRHATPLVSTYFDSTNLALENGRMSLRVRREGDRIVQTLKRQMTPSSGFFVRTEYETECVGPEPDLEYVRRHCPARLRKELNGPLKPVFCVDLHRTEWPISWKGSQVSVSLDEGIIRGGAKSEPVYELEVELHHGNVEAVFDVARRIARFVPLRLEVASKSERGYGLIRDAAVGAEKAHSTRLDRDLTAAAGFQLIASLCIHHFAANERVFLASHLSEPLHQMRVAIRRLRSLISFFEELFSKSERATLRAEIRQVFEKLGEARDLDIVLEALEKNEAQQHSLALPDIRRKRQAAYARVLAMLSSRSFCLRMLDLLAFIECGAWTKTKNCARRTHGKQKLLVGAAVILGRQWKQLCKYENVSHLGAKKRHRFRIRAKSFRYACEFFGDLFAGSKRRHRRNGLLDSLGTLQDDLGDLNDLASVHRLLDQTAKADGSNRAEAEEKDDASEHSLLQAAEAAQRRLFQRRPFWS
jgi:triphosphatase